MVLEVPSPVDGVLKKILRESGETVTSDELLGVIEEGAVAAAEKPTEEAEKPAEKPAKSADEPAKPAAEAKTAPASEIRQN